MRKTSFFFCQKPCAHSQHFVEERARAEGLVKHEPFPLIKGDAVFNQSLFALL